jgi:hypothetical protein
VVQADASRTAASSESLAKRVRVTMVYSRFSYWDQVT